MNTFFLTRDLLCGKDSLNLAPYLFFAPITILVNPLTEADFSDPRNLLLWTLISMLTFVVLVVSVKALQLVMIKKERHYLFPVWVIFAIGAILGGVRGALNYEIALFLELPITLPASLHLRILSAACAWIILTPGFSIISNYLELVKSRRQIIMEQLVFEESLKISNEENLTSIKDATRQAIEDDLSLLLSEVRTQIDNTKNMSLVDQYHKIGMVLTSSSEKLIRPMSHKLASQHREAFPAPRLWNIFIIAIKVPQLPIIPILILSNLAVTSVVAREMTSLIDLALVYLIQNILLWLTILGISKYTALIKRMGVAVLLFGTFFMVITNNILVGVVLGEKYNFMQPQRLFLNFSWFLSVFMVISFVSHIYENEVSITAFVRQMIDSKKIDQILIQEEIFRVKQDIARYLHGNLQSRMMSLGLTLEMSQDRDQSAMNEALTIAQSLLDSPFSQYLSSEDRTLADEVAFNCAQWEGLLTIRSQIADLDSTLSFIQKRAIGAVLEEALANALRHGFAKQVNINISQTETGITVAVQDDGIGPRNNGPGLGSRLYDSIATRGWSLQHRLDGNGTILELNL